MLLVSVTEVALAESVYKVKLSVPHTTVCLGLNNDAPLNCRGGCYFWLDPKVTKRSSPQKCFSALRACAHKTGENLGLQLFRRATLSLQYPVCENLLCPGPPHRLAGFPRFFSEALLRTGKIFGYHTMLGAKKCILRVGFKPMDATSGHNSIFRTSTGLSPTTDS